MINRHLVSTQQRILFVAKLIDNQFHVTIPLPFSGCGTSKLNSTDSNEMKFANRLWINRRTGGRYDMPVPVLEFQCSYTQEYMVVSSLRPV